MSLLNSSRIYQYSLDVFHEHRKLLVFPLLIGGVWLALIASFLLPEAPLAGADIWNWLWQPFQKEQDVRAALGADPDTGDLPILLLAGTWITGMFFTTIINAAFYSQALSALNGGSVSIRHGFAIAFEKLPAIAGWTLFASTVGMILHWIEGWFVAFGSLVTMFLGVGWTAASQFIIPIMLKEPKPQFPLRYLRISASVLRPVWGDGLSLGVVGPSYAAGVWVLCVMVVAGVATFATHTRAPLVMGLLLMLGIALLAGAVTVVFRCGLYIFATEGVAPGPFDADTFNRAWKVR